MTAEQGEHVVGRPPEVGGLEIPDGAPELIGKEPVIRHEHVGIVQQNPQDLRRDQRSAERKAVGTRFVVVHETVVFGDGEREVLLNAQRFRLFLHGRQLPCANPHAAERDGEERFRRDCAVVRRIGADIDVRNEEIHVLPVPFENFRNPLLMTDRAEADAGIDLLHRPPVLRVAPGVFRSVNDPLRPLREGAFMIAVIGLVAVLEVDDAVGFRVPVAGPARRPRMFAVVGRIQVLHQIGGVLCGAGVIGQRDDRNRLRLTAETQEFRETEPVVRPAFRLPDQLLPVEVVRAASAGPAMNRHARLAGQSDHLRVGGVPCRVPDAHAEIVGPVPAAGLLVFPVDSGDLIGPENPAFHRPDHLIFDDNPRFRSQLQPRNQQCRQKKKSFLHSQRPLCGFRKYRFRCPGIPSVRSIPPGSRW